MKRNGSWKFWAWGGAGGFLLVFLVLQSSVSWSAPGIIATLAASNQLSITVTNAATNDCFEVYGRSGLESQFTWSLISTGAVGQTNFLVPMSPGLIGFYRVALGHDWDGDGVVNWQDANPTNSGIGLLTITIDNPANGSILQ